MSLPKNYTDWQTNKDLRLKIDYLNSKRNYIKDETKSIDWIIF